MSAAAAFLPSASLSASPIGAGLGLVARSLSPYQFNPFNLNPLREALARRGRFRSACARARR